MRILNTQSPVIYFSSRLLPNDMVAEIKSEILFTARNTNIILENAKNKSMIQIIQLKHLKQVGVKYIEYLHTVLSAKKDFSRSLYIFLITENG